MILYLLGKMQTHHQTCKELWQSAKIEDNVGSLNEFWGIHNKIVIVANYIIYKEFLNGGSEWLLRSNRNMFQISLKNLKETCFKYLWKT